MELHYTRKLVLFIVTVMTCYFVYRLISTGLTMHDGVWYAVTVVVCALAFVFAKPRKK